MKLHCEVYDAYYDEKGKWLEKKCSDRECEFCVKRPRKHPTDCKCLLSEPVVFHSPTSVELYDKLRKAYLRAQEESETNELTYEIAKFLLDTFQKKEEDGVN